MTQPQATSTTFAFVRDGTQFDPAEYLICQRRGHDGDGRGTTQGMGPTWSYCRWCGVKFRFTEPECVEHPDDIVRVAEAGANDER